MADATIAMDDQSKSANHVDIHDRVLVLMSQVK